MLDKEQLALAKNDPKTFLSQYKLIYIQIESISERIQRFKEYAKYADVDDFLQELACEVSTLKTFQVEIYNLLHESILDESLCKLLELRFLKGQTSDEISEKLHYSERWLLRLQAKAVKLFSDAIIL